MLAPAGQSRVTGGRFVVNLLLTGTAAVAASYYKAVHVLRLGLGKQRLRRLVYVAAKPYVAGRQPERVPLHVKVHQRAEAVFYAVAALRAPLDLRQVKSLRQRVAGVY